MAGLQRIARGFGLAAFLAGASGLAEAQVTAHGEGVAVAVVRAGAVGSASGEVSDVALNIEVTEDGAAALYGYRSMHSVVDIDCRGGRDRVRSAQAFERPHLAGPSQMRPTSGEWVRPTPGAYMSDVIEKVCSRAGLRSAPTATAVVAAAEPTLPPVTSSPKASSPKASSPNASSPTLPRAGGPPATQPPELAVKGGGPSQLRAQIASSSSESAARAFLDRARTEIPPPLTSSVETAEVRGKRVYRSVVEGFKSQAEAQAFCARMHQANVECIVWKDTYTGGR